MFGVHEPSNAPAHRRRANDLRLPTGTRSRRSDAAGLFALDRGGTNHKERKGLNRQDTPPARGATHRLSPSPSVFRPESVWGLSEHSIGEGLHTDSGRDTDGEGERRCVSPRRVVCPGD